MAGYEPRPFACVNRAGCCRYYHGDKTIQPDGTLRATCDAFPAGIPLPLLTGEKWHDEPYEGDGGKRFESNIPSRRVVIIGPRGG